jgi:hypothetical protein
VAVCSKNNMKLINAFHGQIAEIFGVKVLCFTPLQCGHWVSFKLLQNVRLLYRNSDGSGGLSVVVGVQFVLASFCFPFHSLSLY